MLIPTGGLALGFVLVREKAFFPLCHLSNASTVAILNALKQIHLSIFTCRYVIFSQAFFLLIFIDVVNTMPFL